MKSIKLIALSVFVTLGVFCAVLSTSCQKSGCSGVTCLNGGSCGGGLCSCPTGLGGNNCETIYRNIYAATYTGNAIYTATIDTTIDSTGKIDTITHTTTYANNSLVFTATNDSIYQNMQLVWNDATGKQILSMGIVLANFSSTGSTFTFSPILNVNGSDTVTFSGSGSINGTNATLNILESDPHDTASTVITLNCNRQ